MRYTVHQTLTYEVEAATPSEAATIANAEPFSASECDHIAQVLDEDGNPCPFEVLPDEDEAGA